MAAKSPKYDNNSISQLKGADRVRKRPGVIFGSDGLDGCQHSVFEILSNSIDEAREGHGNLINVRQSNLRIPKRLIDYRHYIHNMAPGCNLRHHAAIFPVQRDLRRYHIRQKFPPAAQHRRRRFVTTRLNAQSQNIFCNRQYTHTFLKYWLFVS